MLRRLTHERQQVTRPLKIELSFLLRSLRIATQEIIKVKMKRTSFGNSVKFEASEEIDDVGEVQNDEEVGIVLLDLEQ